MLNSRYVHLSAALGLGALWLKRGAKWAEPNTKQPIDIAQTTHKTAHRPTPQSEPVATPTPAPTAILNSDAQKTHEMRLRLIHATSHNPQAILWLTLRSDLSISAAQISEKSPFSILLTHLQAALGNKEKAAWQSTFSEQFNGIDALNTLCQTQKIRMVIMLGEEIDHTLHLTDALHAQQPNLCVLSLPHPSRLMRSGSLKKQAWTTLHTALTGLASH